MDSNPFTSDTFETVWKKHFVADQPVFQCPYLHNLKFYKHRWLPLYFNLGGTHTKGVSYTLVPGAMAEPGNKVYLIYDVPTYFTEGPGPSGFPFKLEKVRQYPGYLINLEGYHDIDDYLSRNFSKSSRYKLNKYKKRLEQSFDIRYAMYYGEIERTLYESLFQAFRELLEKRFDDKGISNNNLRDSEWNFYKEVAYPMIQEKKAALFVVYHEDTPISVTLNFLAGDILFDAITVFDIDYYKFHLGSVNVRKLIEWCLENKIKTLDFSKGHFDYKLRWANKTYHFDYHLIYNPRSVPARLLALLFKWYFQTKNYLREKKINETYHRLTYSLARKSTQPSSPRSYEFRNLEGPFKNEDWKEIDPATLAEKQLNSIIFDFLYLHEGTFRETRVYSSREDNSLFLIETPGEKKIAKITGNHSPVTDL